MGEDPLFLFIKRREWPQGRPDKLDVGIKSHTRKIHLNNESMTKPLVDYSNVLVYFKCINIVRERRSASSQVSRGVHNNILCYEKNMS